MLLRFSLYCLFAYLPSVMKSGDGGVYGRSQQRPHDEQAVHGRRVASLSDLRVDGNGTEIKIRLNAEIVKQTNSSVVGKLFTP
jgi:hypothetical protein